MIKLISRDFVFKNYPGVTSLIADFQTSEFDDNPKYFEPDDDRQWYYHTFDARNLTVLKTKSSFKILALDHPDFTTFAEVLSGKILELLTQLNITNVVMIAHLRQDFIGKNTDKKNKELQRLVKQFIAITGDKAYDEALFIDDINEDLPFLLHFAIWMQRFGGGFPEFTYFADIDGKIVFEICQYGCIHLTDFNGSVNADLLKYLDLHLVKGSCENQFSS